MGGGVNESGSGDYNKLPSSNLINVSSGAQPLSSWVRAAQSLNEGNTSCFSAFPLSSLTMWWSADTTVYTLRENVGPCWNLIHAPVWWLVFIYYDAFSILFEQLRQSYPSPGLLVLNLMSGPSRAGQGAKWNPDQLTAAAVHEGAA